MVVLRASHASKSGSHRQVEIIKISSWRPEQSSWSYATSIRKVIVSGKRGENLKDEIAREIVGELRLIREELQNLTMAVRSVSTSSNSQNSHTGKSHKSYPRHSANSTDMSHSRGQKPHRSPQHGEPRSQWHQHTPKDTR